jgi:hypothetical protein
LCANRFRRGQLGVGVAFVRHQLAPHFGSREARIQAVRAELWVGLTLAIDQRVDIGQEVGQMVFGAFPPAECERIEADKAAVEFPQTFADGHPAPTQFTCGSLLPASTKFFHSARHKQPTSAALQRLGGFDEHGLDRIG